MFESDAKKYLKKKLKSSGNHKEETSHLSPGPAGSVYEELKLSERLMNDLQESKSQNDNLIERIEELEHTIKNLDAQL